MIYFITFYEYLNICIGCPNQLLNCLGEAFTNDIIVLTVHDLSLRMISIYNYDDMKEKILNIILCMVGLVAVFYGMAEGKNVVFLVGIFLIIIGYILIRKRLKRSNLKRKSFKISDD